MKLIMLGAPGAGKGTQAKKIAAKYDIPHISTGDIFRANIKNGTELGKKAEEYIAKGELVPDEITVPMVVDRLNQEDAQQGSILDGFPRTTEQAEKLDEILARLGKKVDLVINLSTPKEELIDRMLTRRVCTNQDCKTTYNIKLNPPKVEGICDKCGSALKQREDDSNPEAIHKRLEIYDKQTSPLVEYYNNKGVLRTEVVSAAINRMGKDVAEDIIKDIKK